MVQIYWRLISTNSTIWHQKLNLKHLLIVILLRKFCIIICNIHIWERRSRQRVTIVLFRVRWCWCFSYSEMPALPELRTYTLFYLPGSQHFTSVCLRKLWKLQNEVPWRNLNKSGSYFNWHTSVAFSCWS